MRSVVGSDGQPKERRIHEVLLIVSGNAMPIASCFDEDEFTSQFDRQLLLVVAAYWQTAALFGAIGSKGRQDDRPSWRQSAHQRCEVPPASPWISQKMKERTVVPHVDRLEIGRVQKIFRDPSRSICSGA